MYVRRSTEIEGAKQKNNVHQSDPTTESSIQVKLDLIRLTG